jgi:hypothetical protein
MQKGGARATKIGESLQESRYLIVWHTSGGGGWFGECVSRLFILHVMLCVMCTGAKFSLPFAKAVEMISLCCK